MLVYVWLKEWLSSQLVDYWMQVMEFMVVGCVLLFHGGICGTLVTWLSARLARSMFYAS